MAPCLSPVSIYLNYIFLLSAAGLSQSVSRDTGLGSTLHTNDTPTTPLDVGHSETQDLTSGETDIFVCQSHTALALAQSISCAVTGLIGVLQFPP